jgi:hypothetical protein
MRLHKTPVLKAGYDFLLRFNFGVQLFNGFFKRFALLPCLCVKLLP